MHKQSDCVNTRDCRSETSVARECILITLKVHETNATYWCVISGYPVPTCFACNCSCCVKTPGCVGLSAMKIVWCTTVHRTERLANTNDKSAQRLTGRREKCGCVVRTTGVQHYTRCDELNGGKEYAPQLTASSTNKIKRGYYFFIRPLTTASTWS